MKWKCELIAEVILIMQMVFIFFSWGLKLFSVDDAPSYVAIGVLIIGLFGGIVMALLKNRLTHENIPLEKAIKIIGAIFVMAGFYSVIFPVLSIVTHSATSALLLVLGILSPWLIHRAMPYHARDNNA